MKPVAIFLYELSGKSAEPFAAAGWDCYCIDIQHQGNTSKGNIHFVQADARRWKPTRDMVQRCRFFAAFPPCDDLAISGARWFKGKGLHRLSDAIELFDDGIPMVEVRQGMATMGPVNGELIRAVNGRLIRHDGHPVLRNHFAGVAAVVNDTGMIRQSKADPQHGHIDGSVAAAMAVGRLALGATSQSAYNAPNAGGLFVF